MAEERVLAGGCLCARVRYSVRGALAGEGAAFCHCRLCQRAAGAPVVAWATFPEENFKWVAGEELLRAYFSSPKGVRRFCSECGTPLTFAYREGPPLVDVTIASFDDPTAVRPSSHIWTESRIEWLEIGDSLPQYADQGADYRPIGM